MDRLPPDVRRHLVDTWLTGPDCGAVHALSRSWRDTVHAVDPPRIWQRSVSTIDDVADFVPRRFQADIVEGLPLRAALVSYGREFPIRIKRGPGGAVFWTEGFFGGELVVWTPTRRTLRRLHRPYVSVTWPWMSLVRLTQRPRHRSARGKIAA